jgi:general secretion pathway protein D
MDVPVLGRLFRADRDVNDRVELLLLITPFVVRNREEASDVTEEFSERLEGLKRIGEMMRKRHERFIERRRSRQAAPPEPEGVEIPPLKTPKGGAGDIAPRESAP